MADFSTHPLVLRSFFSGMSLHILPTLDSREMAGKCRRELDIARDLAAEWGRSAVEAARAGG